MRVHHLGPALGYVWISDAQVDPKWAGACVIKKYFNDIRVVVGRVIWNKDFN